MNAAQRVERCNSCLYVFNPKHCWRCSEQLKGKSIHCPGCGDCFVSDGFVICEWCVENRIEADNE